MDATQQKGSPKQLRGRSLGTKLSEVEYAQCEKSAARLRIDVERVVCPRRRWSQAMIGSVVQRSQALDT